MPNLLPVSIAAVLFSSASLLASTLPSATRIVEQLSAAPQQTDTRDAAADFLSRR